MPLLRERIFASWITTPSAVGSEKGIPISMRSAPAFSISKMNFTVLSASGSPAVRKPMNAFLFGVSNTFLIYSSYLSPFLLSIFHMLISSVMNIHTTVSRDGCHILVTSSGQTYDNALIRAVILCDLTHLCYRMGTLDGADDSLGSCQIFKASTASSSVMGTYCALPMSCR